MVHSDVPIRPERNLTLGQVGKLPRRWSRDTRLFTVDRKLFGAKKNKTCWRVSWLYYEYLRKRSCGQQYNVHKKQTSHHEGRTPWRRGTSHLFQELFLKSSSICLGIKLTENYVQADAEGMWEIERCGDEVAGGGEHSNKEANERKKELSQALCLDINNTSVFAAFFPFLNNITKYLFW